MRDHSLVADFSLRLLTTGIDKPVVSAKEIILFSACCLRLGLAALYSTILDGGCLLPQLSGLRYRRGLFGVYIDGAPTPWVDRVMHRTLGLVWPIDPTARAAKTTWTDHTVLAQLREVLGLTEVIPDAVITLNANGEIESLNNAARQLLNLTDKDVPAVWPRWFVIQNLSRSCARILSTNH